MQPRGQQGLIPPNPSHNALGMAPPQTFHQGGGLVGPNMPGQAAFSQANTNLPSDPRQSYGQTAILQAIPSEPRTYRGESSLPNRQNLVGVQGTVRRPNPLSQDVPRYNPGTIPQARQNTGRGNLTARIPAQNPAQSSSRVNGESGEVHS